jgi:RNA polymerase sigma-70 factor (ECF subfamily)
MNELDRASLRDTFVSFYENLQIHLTRQLGCKALARETLHDTYVRLHRPGEISVLQPRAYLLRMALNIAADNRRSRDRGETLCDFGNFAAELRDESADLLGTVVARQDLERLEKALVELTPRRRRILLDSRLNGLTLFQIAGQMRVSQRLVETELKAALAHCAQRLERSVVQRFGPQSHSAARRKAATATGHAHAAEGGASVA